MSRKALVTGATSGIGREVAILLAQKKYALILSGREEKALKEIKEQLSHLTTVTTIVADLNRREERQKVVRAVQEELPDLVINNAGFALYGEALQFSVAEQMAILEVNVNAVLEITLEAAKSWKAQLRQGTVLNVSSIASFYLMPTSSVYVASKACVTSFSQSLDMEFEKDGIRVLVFCPGMVKTAFHRRASRRSEDNPSFFALDAKKTAEAILWQIEKQKPCLLYDWKYRFTTYLSHLLPSRLIGHFTRLYMQSKTITTEAQRNK